MELAPVAAIIAVALAAAIGARHLVLQRFGDAPSDTPASPTSASPSKQSPQTSKRSFTEAFRKAGEMAQQDEEDTSKVRLELLQAGMRIDPLTWRGIQVVSALCALVIGSGILVFAQLEPTRALMAFALALFLGYGTPKLYLASRKRERKKSIRTSLPSALELLNTAMRAGYSLERGIRLIGTATKGPLALEFRRVDQEINLLGMPLDRSLLRMKARCDTPCVSSFVNAIVQAHSQGTSMTRALNAQAKSVRAQHFADLLVAINQLPNKMIPVIFVFFFPAIIVLAVAPVVYNAAILLQAMA